MTSEMYVQIKKAKEELEREQREIDAEVARQASIRDAEVARQASIRDAEETSRNSEREKVAADEKEKRNKIWQEVNINAGIVKLMFQEIMDNELQITLARLKEINADADEENARINIKLRWGEKFNPTYEEQKMMKKYYYNRLALFTSIPSEIVISDYFSIGASVTNDHVSLGHASFKPEDFRQDPKIASRALAKALISPAKTYSVKTKGIDYFMIRPFLSSSGPTEGPGCCCS